MGWINDRTDVLYMAITVAFYFKPEYLVHGSKALTFSLLFLITAISKCIYQLFLYPVFFTPLKQIKSPKVSTCMKTSYPASN